MRIVIGGRPAVGEPSVPKPITTIEVWYDHAVRLWVVQALDADQNQIGDAQHAATKTRAREYARKDADFIGCTTGLRPDIIVHKRKEG